MMNHPSSGERFLDARQTRPERRYNQKLTTIFRRCAVETVV
jgi:hypothetical protein